MKKLILLLFVLFTFNVNGQEEVVTWTSNYMVYMKYINDEWTTMGTRLKPTILKLSSNKLTLFSDDGSSEIFFTQTLEGGTNKHGVMFYSCEGYWANDGEVIVHLFANTSGGRMIQLLATRDDIVQALIYYEYTPESEELTEGKL